MFFFFKHVNDIVLLLFITKLNNSIIFSLKFDFYISVK